MTDISIQLPDEVFSGFRCTPQDFVEKMKLKIDSIKIVFFFSIPLALL